MKFICPLENCTGCMSCATTCVHNAISVVEDELGFLRPVIDENRCVDCGACRRVCPELNRVEMRFPIACFAAAISDRSHSNDFAFGGVASTIARHFIEKGGIVVACCGNVITDIHHKIIRNIEELPNIAGSKYVQSRISPNLLLEIKNELIKGSEVLFIGAGCQTAGIKNLFSKRFNNLTIIDLVCHGVPSQKMLNDNIEYYKGLYPSLDISSIRFREKKDGIISYGWYAKTTGDKPTDIFVPWRKDAYMAAFLEHLSLRACCSLCRYAFSARATDITLCDFWGLGNDSVLKDRNGVSAVLINTEKGKTLFNSLSGLDIEQREVGEAVRGVGRLQTPSPYNPMTNTFRTLYSKEGLQKAVSVTAFAKFKRERIKSIPLLGGCLRIMARILR